MLATGSPNEKMLWFLRLFYWPRLLFPAWLFYIARAAVETAALAALPALLHFSIGSVWLRLLVGTLVAAPVYSYLKMVSFKFFLELYRDCPLVFTEYRAYFTGEAKTGDKVDFVIEDNGRVLLEPSTLDIKELEGMLHRPGRKAVLTGEMKEAIRRRFKGKTAS